MRNTEILDLKEKLCSCVDFLLTYIQKQTVLKDDNLHIDTFPLFSLHINLKKNLYENLLTDIFKQGVIKDRDLDTEFEELKEKTGIKEKNGVLIFKELKNFVKKKVPYMYLDYSAFASYVNAIEELLTYTNYCVIVAYLYELLNLDSDFKIYNKNTHTFSLELLNSLDDSIYCDSYFTDLHLVFADSLWTDNGIESNEEILYPALGELEHAFLEWKKIKTVLQPNSSPGLSPLKAILYENEKAYAVDKNIFIPVLEGEIEKGNIKNSLNMIVKLFQAKEMELNSELVVNTLEKTYKGMFRIVFGIKVSQLLSDKGITRQTLIKECHIDKTRVSSALNIYGDVVFNEKDIIRLAEYLKIPTTYFTTI